MRVPITARMFFVLSIIFASEFGQSGAAEATTGTVVGVVTANGTPVANARLTLASPSGIYNARSDDHGRFTALGVAPDVYSVSVQATGYRSAKQNGVIVFPGETQYVAFRLVSTLRTIASVQSTSRAFAAGSTSDSFTVSGAQARALSPPVSSSGLSTYVGGTVQGAIASVPGVVLDPFANAILRGGKVSDAIFDYDSVPLPQGLIAEPGGNIVGAQLPTTGVASTTTTLAGYATQGDNSLGGVVDEIPAVGTYPGSVTLESGFGLGAQFQQNSLQVLGATPDLKWRYAFATMTGSQYFLYGNGSFYPEEAATYGLALQNRGEYSMESNVHYRIDSNDDISILGLVGQASYDQYGSPYAGETVGAFDGQTAAGTPVSYPGEVNPNAAVDYASGLRGSYSILKAQWLHNGAHSLSRAQLYQTQYGAEAGGPFWDENGWPDGIISLSQRQGSRETGLGYDGEDIIGEHHDLRFGAEYRTNTASLNQVVPTAGEFITSNPTLISYLAYFGDTWHVTPRLDFMANGRFTDTHIIPSSGSIYDDGALDPHLSASYNLTGNIAARITYDRNTVAPLPLETDRIDSTNVDPVTNAPAPFVQLSPEIGNDLTYSLEGGTRMQFRATLFNINEQNLIDVLPYNFRSALQSGLVPNGVGVPTNVGGLRARGAELWLSAAGFTLDSNFIRAYSSSASQFAFNDLNAPAVAAGVLFPVSYLPNFSASLSYEWHTRDRKLRVSPSLSYESGYPYGNGKMVWVFNPATGKPEEVPNDNYYDPGYNYYFLENPAEPYNATSNPYIGSLGTAEADFPNSLHSPPETFVNLHLEYDLTPRWTAVVDVVNLLNNDAPTSYQGNPYLIGAPGYAGGNPLYAAAYEAAGGYSVPYTLGNGVPTNDGQTQAVPWTYGRAGYVPQNWPMGRTVQFRLRLRLP
ncbi:MAG TPA: TonB-dependent receptor [Candidatus Baltobacteraceae bacterium]|nr:TonB-dependent receptor [Candidatus Baltobacteraceae bacterium]